MSPRLPLRQAETPVPPHAEAVAKCQGLLDRNGHAARRAASEAVGGCRDRSIVYSRFDLPRRCRPRWPAGQSTTVALSLVRIFCTAPSLSDAHRVHLNAHQVQFDGGVAIAAGYAPVEVDDVEIEWEHTSEYDKETARWDVDGEVEPFAVSPDRGNLYRT